MGSPEAEAEAGAGARVVVLGGPRKSQEVIGGPRKLKSPMSNLQGRSKLRFSLRF